MVATRSVSVRVARLNFFSIFNVTLTASRISHSFSLSLVLPEILFSKYFHPIFPWPLSPKNPLLMRSEGIELLSPRGIHSLQFSLSSRCNVHVEGHVEQSLLSALTPNLPIFHGRESWQLSLSETKQSRRFICYLTKLSSSN
jgi:hypothetical protein